MKLLRSHIVTAARECIGTPFRHMGRVPGVELDCVGLIIAAGRMAGVPMADAYDYTERPTGRELLAELYARFDEVHPDDARKATVLVFRIGRRSTHVGILTEPGVFIHAYNRCAKTKAGTLSKVREEYLTDRWTSRISHAFDWRGIADG